MVEEELPPFVSQDEPEPPPNAQNPANVVVPQIDLNDEIEIAQPGRAQPAAQETATNFVQTPVQIPAVDRQTDTHQPVRQTINDPNQQTESVLVHSIQPNLVVTPNTRPRLRRPDALKLAIQRLGRIRGTRARSKPRKLIVSKMFSKGRFFLFVQLIFVISILFRKKPVQQGLDMPPFDRNNLEVQRIPEQVNI